MVAGTNNSPYWGAQTSYLNFCEEDYVVTRYVAEFINTLSSLAFVAYGIFGLTAIRWSEQTGGRLVSYFGLIGVGMCSAGYHMTLKYHTQMSDELSMHLLTTPLLYRLLSFQASRRTANLLAVVLTALFTAVMVAHMVLDEFLLHAVTFGFQVVLIVYYTTVLIPQRITDPQALKRMQIVARFGVVSFAFGYLVWLIDDWACDPLTSVRHSVGMPLAFLTELHGWWHIFTAIGGYIALASVDEITSEKTTKNATARMAWPIPLVAKAFYTVPKPVKQS